MTPEQIQSAIDRLEQLVSQLRMMTNHYEGELLLAHGEPQYIQDCNDAIKTILTQALEIAKGDKVVVSREPTNEIICAAFEVCDGYNAKYYQRLYKAMIAVAEGK
jgi:hypothetical protein